MATPQLARVRCPDLSNASTAPRHRQAHITSNGSCLTSRCTPGGCASGRAGACDDIASSVPRRGGLGRGLMSRRGSLMPRSRFRVKSGIDAREPSTRTIVGLCSSWGDAVGGVPSRAGEVRSLPV